MPPHEPYVDRARAQSEIVAIVLLLAVVILGATAIITTGTFAIDESRQSSNVAHAEQVMTQIDSNADLVALDSTSIQNVDLGSSDGRYRIDEDAGWLRIRHINYTPGEVETVYNGSLGALTYRSGDTAFAYQGGGVWRTDGEGATMVSPPEFYYRDETLVLPVVRVRGNGTRRGAHEASLRTAHAPRRVFPNQTAGTADGVGAPYDDTDAPYVNPIEGGNVTITIGSDYYRAWGRYLETRTQGHVTYDDANETATVELVAPRTLGHFDMPAEGNSLHVRGLADDHVVQRFSLFLAPDDSDAAKFDNLQWSLWVEKANLEFEIHFKLEGPNDDSTTACKEQSISATIYYSDANGDPYHGWRNPSAFETHCVDADGDSVDDEVRLAANLTSNTTMTMTDLGSNSLEHFNPKGSTRKSNVTFSSHQATVAWEPKTFSDGGDDDTTSDRLINHYFAELGPNFDITVEDQNSDTVNEQASSGILEYGGEGRVTFLHVTKNGVVVVIR